MVVEQACHTYDMCAGDIGYARLQYRGGYLVHDYVANRGKEMKNILLISTGGTIASTATDKGLSSTLSGDDIVRIAEINTDALDLTVRNLFSIDSTLIQPEDWVVIAEAIAESDDEYDGFIITHGTDTLAYTSSMLSYMLGPINKPVIVTGSMKTVQEQNTDAIDNLRDSFAAVREDIGGVYVVFNHKLIMGSRSAKLKSVQYDAFISVNAPFVAYIKDGRVWYNAELEQCKKGLRLNTRFESKIVVLKFFPGLDPNVITSMYEAGYRGMVLESYGSGGMPYRRRDIAAKVGQLAGEIPILLTPQVVHDGVHLDVYEVGQRALETGVISACDMAKEASITKMMWALGQTQDPSRIKEIMYTNYVGELSAE